MKTLRAFIVGLALCAVLSLGGAKAYWQSRLQVTAGPTTKSLVFTGHEMQGVSCGSATCTYSNGGTHYTIATPAVVFASVFANPNSSIVSSTVCGQTGTTVVSKTSTGGSVTEGIVAAFVSTGTTCDVTVTWNATPSRTGAGIYYSTSLSSVTANSTNTANGCTTCSAAVTAVAGGFVLAASGQNSNFTPTWTNVTQDFADAQSTNGENTGASATNTSAGTVTPQVATQSSGGAAFVAAAY